MIAFITGVSGQDGSYLANFLLKKNYQVHGLVLPNADLGNLRYFGIERRIKLHTGDIRAETELKTLINRIQPKEIYNLAAHSFVGDSWDNVKRVNEINYFGVINLLDAIRATDPAIRFLQASTSEMFGLSHDNGLQTEETPFHPRSPYAISKLAAYEIVNNYRDSYGLFAANAICFNHESPLRPPRFVTRKITLGAARIKAGLDRFIELGDLDSVRDWGFAGDYVEAMHLMLEQNKPDNYILSTGLSHSVKDVLDIAFSRAGIADWKDRVKLDPKFRRPVELKRLIGSNAKAKKILGWVPHVGFRELIELMVDEDLKRLQLG